MFLPGCIKQGAYICVKKKITAGLQLCRKDEDQIPPTTLPHIPPWENQLTSTLTSALQALVCICVSADLQANGFIYWNKRIYIE